MQSYCAKTPGKCVEEVVQTQLAKCHPLVETFTNQFYRKHDRQLLWWKFCRVFDPFHAADAPVDSLRDDLRHIFPQLESHLPYLQASLDVYRGHAAEHAHAHAAEHAQHPTTLSFWMAKKDSLIGWFECFQFVSVLQPTSAAAERVFAILRTKFSSCQESTLEDYKAASVKMTFNKRVIV